MTNDQTAEELLYEERDGIGWVTFNRPAARNALTFAMYDGVAEIASRTAAELPKVLVFTGAGDRAFAAGTDIAQFLDFHGESDVFEYEAHMSDVLERLESCPVPTIAAIRGACTGGGAAIAAACDIRIGTPSAVFGVPVARTLGNCLSMANFGRLASIVGAARLKEVMLTARLVDAPESLRIGWLHEIVASDEGLLERAEEVAKTMLSNAPLTMRATKMALKRITDQFAPEDGKDLIAMCYLSEDFREGVEAFLEKRRPNWQGR